MKLKNKKTGETGYYLHTHRDHKNGSIKVAVLKEGEPFSEFKPYEPIYDYDSLAELNAEWEDYEEPKEFWYIGQDGVIFSDIDTITQDYADRLQEIGNYFETKEEAEKAVEKLKAWKRLRDEGFKFTQWRHDVTNQKYIITMEEKGLEEWVVGRKKADLDLLFGGEE